MMSPRPPPQPPPPPLTHLHQLLTSDRSGAAPNPPRGPLPPLLPPPPLQRSLPNVQSVKTTEAYHLTSQPRPLPPPPIPSQPRRLTSVAGSPPRQRSNLAPPLPVLRRPPGPPPVPQVLEAPYPFNPDVGRIAQTESFVEVEQSRRRRSISHHPPQPLPPPPPPPLYPRSEAPVISPDSEFAVPRYVHSVGQSMIPPSSPKDRRLSNTSLAQSPNTSYPTRKKRSFDETFSEDPKAPSSVHTTPRGSITSEYLRSFLPPRPMSDKFRLVVRQQPAAARACGFGERDRRVIDPPPIVQLIPSDPSSTSSESDIRYPFNVVHCTLWNVAGSSDETALEQQDKRLTRRLMGTLVSSPFVGQDENGEEGCFFCFPDLSCRTHGKFRLKFVLMCLDPLGEQSSFTPVTTEVMSEVFTVYTAKEFPGMRPSTGLTKALKRQGCAISVKKGNEKATQASPQEEEDEKSGEGDESENETASRNKRRKKT